MMTQCLVKVLEILLQCHRRWTSVNDSGLTITWAYQTNTMRWPNAASLSAHCLRCWLNIETASGQRLVLAECTIASQFCPGWGDALNWCWLVLGNHLRRWPSIEQSLGRCKKSLHSRGLRLLYSLYPEKVMFFHTVWPRTISTSTWLNSEKCPKTDYVLMNVRCMSWAWDHATEMLHILIELFCPD